MPTLAIFQLLDGPLQNIKFLCGLEIEDGHHWGAKIDIGG
jgi:hypothetical protein